MLFVKYFYIVSFIPSFKMIWFV